MNPETIAFALLVEHAGSDNDDEQYRQGHWDAIVQLIQLTKGISEDAATEWVHAQYSEICAADLI